MVAAGACKRTLDGLLSLSRRLVRGLVAPVAAPPKAMVFRIQFSDSLKAGPMMNFLPAVICILSFVSVLFMSPASGQFEIASYASLICSVLYNRASRNLSV